MPPIQLDYGQNDPQQHWVPRGITVLALIVLLLLSAFLFRPTIRGRAEAKEPLAKAQLSNISGALRRFEEDTGRYPSEAEGFDALIHVTANDMYPRAPYLRDMLSDPWGNYYVYEVLPTGACKITSLGPDGIKGTADDITLTSR